MVTVPPVPEIPSALPLASDASVPVSDTAVVLAGSVSVTVMEAAVADPAVAGPLFFTVCV